MPEPTSANADESGRISSGAGSAIRYVQFRPLPVVLTLVTISLMFVLAQHIIERFRAAQLSSQSHLAEVYISRFLAPYALDLLRGETGEATRLTEVVALLDPGTRRGGQMAMHIWGVDGSLLFTSTPEADLSDHDDTDLKLAIQGQVVEMVEEDLGEDARAPLPAPYLEVYMPILSPKGDHVVAVGEIYFDATTILAEIRNFERTVTFATGFATVAVLLMLAASAYQSEQLRQRLEAERQLALQNEALRKIAEQARLDASRANEETLNLVGAELHDGPVQLLTLASLMPTPGSVPDPAKGVSQATLIRQAVEQIRGLSAGLILPEIEDLHLNQLVDLATDRFRALSETPLRFSCPETTVQIDLPRRICIYRVIQEGLSNASRHGSGGIVDLTIDIRDNIVGITIVSPSEGAVASEKSRLPTQQLGLQAMRRRLATFGGTAVLLDGGTKTTLQVDMPI